MSVTRQHSVWYFILAWKKPFFGGVPHPGFFLSKNWYTSILLLPFVQLPLLVRLLSYVRSSSIALKWQTKNEMAKTKCSVVLRVLQTMQNRQNKSGITFFFILLTHEGSHREVYQEFQPNYDILYRWWQGLIRPKVPCTPRLHFPIANYASTQSQQTV